MINLLSYPLKIAKGIYSKFDSASSNYGRDWNRISIKDYTNDQIYNALLNNDPVMIARLGSTELTCMVNYIGVKNPGKYKSLKGYISQKTPPWWWNKSGIQQMQNWSGFFPATIVNIDKFCEMMIADLSKVDILGSWLKQEVFFNKELSGSKKVVLEDLEPFFASTPWTYALKDKKVLVIHPFAEQIESQYLMRDKLFENNLLPHFELLTIKAVQSIAGEATQYDDWFQALDSMKKKIDEVDFDICILGCGAYGFPLAAYVKDIGKKAIHLGGVTQLLFGIKGARWEKYLVYPYENLYNKYWVRPSDNNKPKNASLVEGACYW